MPARDLALAFTCPRCGASDRAASLVDVATPLRAVPVVGTPAHHYPPASGTMPLAVYAAQARPREDAPVPPAGSTPVEPPPPAGAVVHNEPIAAPVEPSPAQNRLPISTRLVIGLGQAAWWLDRATQNFQLILLTVLSAFVWLISHFAPSGYVASLFVYTSILYLLLLARLWWIREDDGTWSWRRFSERSSAAINEYFRGLFAIREFSWANLIDQLTMTLLAVGSMLIVLGPPSLALLNFGLEAIGGANDSSLREFARTLEPLGGILVVCGILGLLRRFERRSPAAQTFKTSVAALRHRPDLPFVIDVWEGAKNSASLPLELRVLVETLAKWQPRSHQKEAGYEGSLRRFLLRELPGSSVACQVPLASPEGIPIGKMDMVVDDTLVIELKQELRRAAEVDRAVGQVGKYAAAWTKGPVILLVCETEPGFEQAGFMDRLAVWRRVGHAVFVVAAGRRYA